MRDRGLVTHAPLTTVFAAVLLAAVALTPKLASADCFVNPECTPSVDGSGCCKPNCTWKDVGASCRDEANACHTGTCADAGGGTRTCTETIPTNNAANGSKCVVPENVCLIGRCHGGNCGGIGSAGSGEFDPRCPATDSNPCTDHCDAPSNVFQSCSNVNAPNGLTCYANSGTDCLRGVCSNGACSTSGSPINCGTPPVCQRNTCDPTEGCDTEPTLGSCDTNPNDCTDSQCTTKGNCKHNAEDAGTSCSPGDGNSCTFDECNSSKDCNVAIWVPNGTDCTAASTTFCQYDECRDGACTALADETKVGQVCQTDTSVCTNQKCNTLGQCAIDTCNGGLACTVCGGPGTCLPQSQGCGCNPN
jgi:hypothetical protein